MGDVILYGIAAMVLSIGLAALARQRCAAYAVVRPTRPERPRVR